MRRLTMLIGLLAVTSSALAAVHYVHNWHCQTTYMQGQRVMICTCSIGGETVSR